MASLTDARLSVQDPAVKAGQVFDQVDTTAAQAIEAFGTFGGEAVLGHQLGKLKNQYEDVLNISTSINAGQEQLEKDVASGVIDPTSERFQRLAAAAGQGKISQQRLAIEAEVELRRAMNRFPGFEQQFRKLANDQLGFDPTGAALQQLFGAAPDTSVKTQRDKDLELAHQLVETGQSPSVDAAYSSIIEARHIKMKADMSRDQLTLNRGQAGAIATTAVEELTLELAPAMNGILNEIGQTGALKDVGAHKANIANVVRNMKQSWRMAMAEGGQYDKETFEFVMGELDSVAENVYAVMDDAEISKVLGNRASAADAALRLQGMQMFPNLFAMRELGDEFLNWYLDVAQAVGRGDISAFAHIPEARVIEKILTENRGGQFLDAVSAVMSGKAPQLDGFTEEEARAIHKAAIVQATSTGRDSRVSVAAAESAIDTNQVKTGISVVNKDPAAYVGLTPESQAKVASQARVELQNSAKGLTTTLQGTDAAIRWDPRRRKFTLQQRDPATPLDLATVRPGIGDLLGKTEDRRFRERLGETFVTPQPTSEQQAVLDVLNNQFVNLIYTSNKARGDILGAGPSPFAADIIDNPDRAMTRYAERINAEALLREHAEGGASPEVMSALQELIGQDMDIDEVIQHLRKEQVGSFAEKANLIAAEPGQVFIDEERGTVFSIGEGNVITQTKIGEELPDGGVLAGAGAIDRGGVVRTSAPSFSLVPDSKKETADFVMEEARKADLDPNFVLALALAENNSMDALRPNDRGASTARGIFQMTKPTWDTFGDGGPFPTEPKAQTTAAIKMLTKIKERLAEAELPFNADNVVKLWHDGHNIKDIENHNLSEEGVELAERLQRRMRGDGK
jgi:hypothetical protein